MINREICRERFYALLRYGRKYSGSWDDGECKHGDNYCFLPTDDDLDDLCDAYEQYTALSERHQRLVEAARGALELMLTDSTCFGLGVCKYYTECTRPDGECQFVLRLQAARAAVEG